LNLNHGRRSHPNSLELKDQERAHDNCPAGGDDHQLAEDSNLKP